MKKASSIVLMFLLLASSLGLSRGVHYCDGRIVSHFLIPHLPNDCKDMPDTNSCENVVYSKWHVSPFEMPSYAVLLAPIAANIELPAQFRLERQIVRWGWQFKPIQARWKGPDLFLKNGSFLI